MIAHGLDYVDLYPADYVSTFYKTKDGRQCQFLFKCDLDSLRILDCRYYQVGMDACLDICEGLAIGVVGLILSDVKQLNRDQVLTWFSKSPSLDELTLLLRVLTTISED